jgi:hypothetical protein
LDAFDVSNAAARRPLRATIFRRMASAHLNNPVCRRQPPLTDASTGAAITIAQGTTRTQALWFQTPFITPDLEVHGRFAASIDASNGYNQQAASQFDRADRSKLSWLPVQPTLQTLRQKDRSNTGSMRTARCRLDRHGEPLPTVREPTTSRPRRMASRPTQTESASESALSKD